MKICIFCSAGSGLPQAYHNAAAETGTLLARRGHSLVYGGCDHGLMGDIARAAARGGAAVEGIIPNAFRGDGDRSPYCTQVTYTESMRARKALMQERAEAFLVLPGGIGTLDELFDTTVLQTLGQLNKPLVLLNTEGCYDLLAALLDQMVQQNLLTTKNREFYRFIDTPAGCLDYLERCKGERDVL